MVQVCKLLCHVFFTQSLFLKCAILDFVINRFMFRVTVFLYCFSFTMFLLLIAYPLKLSYINYSLNNEKVTLYFSLAAK